MTWELTRDPLHLGYLGLLGVDHRLRHALDVFVLTVGHLGLGHLDCALVMADHRLQPQCVERRTLQRPEFGHGGVVDEDIKGPALIELPDTVVVIHPGETATFDDFGNLVVDLPA